MPEEAMCWICKNPISEEDLLNDEATVWTLFYNVSEGGPDQSFLSHARCELRSELERRLKVPLEFHSGWDQLIMRLIDDLDATRLPYEVDQVKEKFGGLRFYWHVPYEEGEEPKSFAEISYIRDDYGGFENLIREAEEEAYRTCEICGAPGKPQGKSWVRTSCEEHKL